MKSKQEKESEMTGWGILLFVWVIGIGSVLWFNNRYSENDNQPVSVELISPHVAELHEQDTLQAYKDQIDSLSKAK